MERLMKRVVVRRRPHGPRSLPRRAIDILVALAGLVILAPLMLLIALAVRLETPGPALFSQIRIGREGRHFVLYKFRKFHCRTQAGDRPLTLRDDPRFTRLGRVLERTKLDELPQLWNVLRGDMSLVGPRPETLDFADCFQGPYRAVLDHTPGIFGPSQVACRHEATLYPEGCDPREFYRAFLFPMKARLDLAYYARRTVLSDLAWAWRGIWSVFSLSSMPGEAGDRFAALEDWVVGHGTRRGRADPAASLRR
ncbi:sugar transferase [Arenibaculum pallidiluteum]|uniref:sugar transferase n=1 Tax=Arenibaculum pallidiluteum TaxID=2812559 RepID=UPI001A97B7F8|nr:sugar transferase [Arenibaculum pallidiluteum]